MRQESRNDRDVNGSEVKGYVEYRQLSPSGVEEGLSRTSWDMNHRELSTGVEEGLHRASWDIKSRMRNVCDIGTWNIVSSVLML